MITKHLKVIGWKIKQKFRQWGKKLRNRYRVCLVTQFIYLIFSFSTYISKVLFDKDYLAFSL